MSSRSHPESRKRECRIRIGKAVVSMPTDLHRALSREADAWRYRTVVDCMWMALDHGLRILQIQRQQLPTIINNHSQSFIPREEGSEERRTGGR
jgi:hypothetical protein